MERRKSIVAINIAVFMLMLGVGMTVSLFPGKIITLSGSFADVGYLASAFALPYALLQIPVGNLSDRFGFKPFLIGGYLLCSISGVIYSFAGSTHLIFLGRMIQGIGEIPVWAIAPVILAMQYPESRGKVMGIYNASLHCGLMAGSFLGVIVSGIWQDSAPFLLYAALGFSGAAVITALVRIPEERAPREDRSALQLKPLLSLFSSLSNSLLLGGIVLYGAGYGISITVIPAVILENYGGSQAVVGLFFVLFYLALSISQVVTGPLSDLKGRIPVIECGLLMAALGMMNFYNASSLFWFMFMLIISSCGLGMFCIAAMALLNESAPDSLEGTVSGAFFLAWGGGYFFGPLIMGKFVELRVASGGFKLMGWLLLIEFAAVLFTMKGRIKMIKGMADSGVYNSILLYRKRRCNKN